MSVVIKVENVSKQYRLGKIGTGSFSHDMNRWWHTIRGKEDPYLKIGEVNDRTKKSTGEYVWALNNISFEVKQGEVLGIIGKNGAGKSTLLKILSRTTSPTTGSIKIKGRVASLLEVGTGFHPELTGRENVFLNGAILGMTKAEIKSKFDEIVDFSGVEAYIDTPVKRYSSGMYVRLAFAVAAHLEPEILIVDEVLAVGDAEFQKKCLGKMKDVSGQGRAVIFVSHSMTSVQALCMSAVFLENGITNGIESVGSAVSKYLYGSKGEQAMAEYFGENGNYGNGLRNQVIIRKVQVLNSRKDVAYTIKTTESFTIKILWDNIAGVACTPNIQLKMASNTTTALIASDSNIDWKGEKKKQPGSYISTFVIPANWMNANDYFLSVALDSHSPRINFESHVDIIRISIWDPMDESSIARGMFTSVREDAVLWPALECSFDKIS